MCFNEEERRIDCGKAYGLACSATLYSEHGYDDYAVEAIRSAVSIINKYPDLKNRFIRMLNSEQYCMLKDVLES